MISRPNSDDLKPLHLPSASSPGAPDFGASQVRPTLRPQQAGALDEGLRRLDAAARTHAIPGTSIENGILRIGKTESTVPDGTGDLVLDLYRRVPEARITDILLEVDDATRFTETFTHLRTGSPSRTGAPAPDAVTPQRRRSGAGGGA